MAKRRFVSLRGNPQQIYSDSATTFIRASKELKDGIEKLRTDNSFRDALLLLHLDWRFIPPSSPHFGGSWESLVKVFKNAFYRVNGSRTLTHDTLSTFVCEVAAMMNGRPLTQVSSDFRDMEPITPNHSCWAVDRQTFHPAFSWTSQLLSPAVGSKHNRSLISSGIVF